MIIDLIKNYTVINHMSDFTVYAFNEKLQLLPNIIMMYGHSNPNPQKYNKNNTDENPKEEEEFRLLETRSCSPFLFIS